MSDGGPMQGPVQNATNEFDVGDIHQIAAHCYVQASKVTVVPLHFGSLQFIILHQALLKQMMRP